MGVDAGRLRHRVTIERRVNVQDATTGAVTPTWVSVARDVPAAIEPLSVREFIAAAAVQSEVSVRIVIRYRTGIDATMRVRQGKTVYAVEGVLADAGSGRDYLTLACAAGVTEE